MGPTLLRFLGGVMLGLVVTLLEFIVFILPVPNAVPPVFLGFLNVALSWLTVEFVWWRLGHWHAPLLPPKNTARYWVGRGIVTTGLFLERAVLVVALSALILLVAWLVASSSSEQSTKLLQVVAWPIVAVIVVILAVVTQSGTQLFRSITSRLQKVSALGVDLELTAGVAKQVQYNVETGFDEYRQRINAEFDRQVRIRQIDGLLAAVAWESINEVFKEDPSYPPDYKRKLPEEYRCTLHIKDVLLDETLYQLLDYYPTGGGKGRAFSFRYGMIGSVWRLEQDSCDGDVLKEDPKRAENLVRKWATTWSEAHELEQKGAQSMVAVLLADEKGLPVGILYLDSKKKEAFGPNPQMQLLIKHVKEKAKGHQMTQAIVELGLEMRKLGPSLNLLK